MLYVVEYPGFLKYREIFRWNKSKRVWINSKGNIMALKTSVIRNEENFGATVRRIPAKGM